MNEPTEPGANAKSESVVLYETDPATRRKRAVSGFIGVVLFGAACGFFGALIGGLVTGLVVAIVTAVPLCCAVVVNLRRKVWLAGTTVVVRTLGSRVVDVIHASRIDLVVTDLRDVRTIALLINAGQRGRSAKVDLAVYTGTGSKELGVLALRRLADVLMNNTEANGMVFAELLVAQLRAEAREASAADRPLYRLAAESELSGGIVRRVAMDAVARFVTALE